MQPRSRRDFFKDAGRVGLASGLGAIAAGAGCNVLSEGDPPSDPGTDTPPSSATWPFPYAKLNVEDVRKAGHAHFYEGDCCYGAFAAIIDTLAQNLGEPFTSFPTDLMRYGKGGMYGYGTLCGALNGAAAAIQLVAEEETAAKVVTELMNWYATTALPTDKANEYATNHEYLVEQLKTDEALLQNVAGNVLCHVSVSKWASESGYASGSEERKERCARLTGDVAAKAVELLNAVSDVTFEPTLTSLGEQAGCMACHKPGLDFSGGNFTQGKMDCVTCHVDPVFPSPNIPAHGL